MKLNKQTLLFTLQFLILFFTTPLVNAQDIIRSKDYPADFRPPLDLKPVLAGSFGEIRGNHFHSGLDYRTNQREGYPVYAVADGYISRLRVQIGGFGNAVYISHPNGYTSVYAHLQRFNDRILSMVRNNQILKQSFDVDFPLMPIEIPVKKGEIIAWSGNTGSSGGPHLHFELRDSQTEETINAQLFGIDIPDNVKPQIQGLYMYRLNGQPFGPNTVRQFFHVSGNNGNYTLSGAPIVSVNGETGFGISAFDQQVAGGNKNGLYSTELYLDNVLIFSAVLERFAFSNSRAVNAHIDYPYYLNSGITVQKSFVEPGNPLTIYKNLVNRGIVNLTDTEIHDLKYILKDIKGNISTLELRVKNDPASVIPQKTTTGIKTFAYNTTNEYSTSDFKISVPKGVLYSDINFNYSKSKRTGGYSDLHIVHSRTTPAHDSFTIGIKPTKEIPAYLRNKLLLVNANGGYAGGAYDEKDGFVKGYPKTFGSYYVTIDTTAPSIRPVNIAEGKDLSEASRISLKISDNLSGLKSFSGYIDGKWVLMEYNFKTSLLWHTFDETTAGGKHLFELRAVDMQGNIKLYSATFYR